MVGFWSNDVWQRRFSPGIFSAQPGDVQHPEYYRLNNLSLRSGAGLICLFSSLSLAQTGGPSGLTQKSVSATRVSTAPEIDGRLDDSAWQDAPVVDDLHEVNPNEFGAPSEESRFFIVHNDDYLFVGARFLDSEPDKVVARVMRQGDFSEGEDGLRIIIDPFNQGRSGYLFDLNPNGIRGDALFNNVTEENWDWQGIWHGAAELTDEGWTAEVAIPFKTLSFDPDNETWGINFSRTIGRRNEDIGWVSYNRTQNPANSGKLVGMTGLRQGLGLDIVPGFRATKSRDFITPDSSTNFEPSLDVFYKPTPSMTAALTINTDFSGTSADERQINLSRFSVFFPEQRNFFLQDTDIFEFGRIGGEDNRGSGAGRATRESGRPFFSRRIGLSEDGEAIDLKGGLKLTGRIGRWDYGLLDIQQEAFEDVDSKNLFVARVSAGVLEESTIGAIVTHGDPSTNDDNSLIGIDFRYLNTRLSNNRTLEGAAWYQRSDTTGLSGDDEAFGFSVRAPNTEGWLGELEYKEIQQNFNPALGFVNQNNVRTTLWEVSHIWRPQSGRVRSIKSGIRGSRTEIIDGRLDAQRIDWDLARFENNSGDNILFWLQSLQENLTEPFEIIDGIFIQPGDYSWSRHCVRGATGEHRVLKVDAFLCGGGFFDGERISSGPGLTWRPSAHFKLRAEYRAFFIDLSGGSFITRQTTVRADVAFTSTWYWENLLQYDNVSDSIGINSILRWIPLAGREMVLVLNREFVDLEENRDFTSTFSDLTFKINYTFRF